jgi:hypothetical protein
MNQDPKTPTQEQSDDYYGLYRSIVTEGWYSYYGPYPESIYWISHYKERIAFYDSLLKMYPMVVAFQKQANNYREWFADLESRVDSCGSGIPF